VISGSWQELNRHFEYQFNIEFISVQINSFQN
jgi:hypothetical protein